MASNDTQDISVPVTTENATVNVDSSNDNSHYGYVRVELFRSIIACIAVLGSIFLGVQNPSTFGASAMTTLGVAVGGYFGVQQSRRQP